MQSRQLWSAETTLPARVVYWATALAFLVGYFHVHQLAAYNFPVPWIDESDILWRANAFAKTGTLYAPQVFFGPHYNRVPGYMLFMGTVFHFGGCSLYVARLTSCVLVAASFLMLAAMTARYRFRFLSLILCGAFLLSEPFVAVGNIGRMEALLLFGACLGFLLLQRGYDLAALAVILMGPLIHPNGMYFLVAGVLYVLVVRLGRAEGFSFSRRETAFLLVAVGIWCAYAVYVGLHWQLHYMNMKSQWAIKFNRDLRGQMLTQGNVMLMLATLACAAYCWTKNLKVGFLLVVAMPGWVLYGIGHEMWYQVFSSLFYALFSIVAVEVLTHLIEQIPRPMAAQIRYAIASLITAGFLVWNYQAGRLEHPSNYPWNMLWGGMRMQSAVPYLSDADIAAVGGFLDSLRSPGRVLRVRFIPDADALVFPAWEGRGLRISQNVADTEGPGVYIIHTSRALPTWLRQQVQDDLRRVGINAAAAPRMLRQRDGTEAWYYAPIVDLPQN